MDLKTTLKNFDKETIQIFGEMFAESIKMATEHTKSAPETLVKIEEILKTMSSGFEKVHDRFDGLREEFIPRKECEILHGISVTENEKQDKEYGALLKQMTKLFFTIIICTCIAVISNPRILDIIYKFANIWMKDITLK